MTCAFAGRWAGTAAVVLLGVCVGCSEGHGRGDDDTGDIGGSLYDDPFSVLDTVGDAGNPKPWLDAAPDEPADLPDAGTPDTPDAASDDAVDGGSSADVVADVPAAPTPIGWDEDNPVSLINHNAWQLAAPGAASDPFWPADAGAAAAIAPCGSADIEVKIEDIDSWVEVDTTGCGWATMSQPALVGAAPGDLLRVRVWRWKILDGDGGYKLSVHLGAPDALDLIWEETLDVPGSSGLWVGTYEVKTPIAAGTPVWWHVQNHGINTWNLIEVARLDAIYP